MIPDKWDKEIQKLKTLTGKSEAETIYTLDYENMLQTLYSIRDCPSASYELAGRALGEHQILLRKRRALG